MRRDVNGKFESFAGDIRNQHKVCVAMKGCDAVLHLAAMITYHAPDTYV